MVYQSTRSWNAYFWRYHQQVHVLVHTPGKHQPHLAWPRQLQTKARRRVWRFRHSLAPFVHQGKHRDRGRWGNNHGRLECEATDEELDNSSGSMDLRGTICQDLKNETWAQWDSHCANYRHPQESKENLKPYCVEPSTEQWCQVHYSRVQLGMTKWSGS